jgi:hypothetical protein
LLINILTVWQSKFVYPQATKWIFQTVMKQNYPTKGAVNAPFKAIAFPKKHTLRGKL